MERKKVLSLFEEQKDIWQARANAGIEAYRKGDICVKVTDGKGRPVRNAEIRLTQKSHEFRFGANLFMLEELETEEKNKAYQARFSHLFNMATLPFYWNATEPERGKTRYSKDSPKLYRRPTIDLCIEYCEANGIEPREHALAYDGFFPKWLCEAGVDEVKEALERRFAEVAERYAKKIPTIEVTNELEWSVGRTAFYYEPDYLDWCMRTAEKYFPNNKLAINEHTAAAFGDNGRTTDKYYAYTEAALLRGTRIDAIGMQYHSFFNREEEYERTRPYYDPENLYRHLDLYARLGRPLQVTEITIPSYSWEREDEEIQAKIIEHLYTIWFSHPSVEQIIYWNLVDGYAHLWDPDPEKIILSQGNMTLGENYYHGGLLRFDMTPKPAYLKLCELIKERWCTKATLRTDKEGCVKTRGFFGSYELAVIADGRAVKLTLDLSKAKGKSEISISL